MEKGLSLDEITLLCSDSAFRRKKEFEDKMNKSIQRYKKFLAKKGRFTDLFFLIRKYGIYESNLYFYENINNINTIVEDKEQVKFICKTFYEKGEIKTLDLIYDHTDSLKQVADILIGYLYDINVIQDIVKNNTNFDDFWFSFKDKEFTDSLLKRAIRHAYINGVLITFMNFVNRNK